MDPTESGESQSIEGRPGTLYPWVRSADFDHAYVIVARSAYRMARAHTDHDSARDIALQVTDALAQAWTSGGLQLATDAAAEGWAQSHLRIRLLRAKRKHARRRNRESSYGLALDAQRRDWMDPGATVEQAELGAAIRRALSAAAPQCRRAWLMVAEGQTRQEVADALGVRPQTASNYLLRAVEVLRRELAPVWDLWRSQEES